MSFEATATRIYEILKDLRENEASCLSYTTEKLLWAQTEAILLFLGSMCEKEIEGRRACKDVIPKMDRK
jgi:hypothetical protein